MEATLLFPPSKEFRSIFSSWATAPFTSASLEIAAFVLASFVALLFPASEQNLALFISIASSAFASALEGVEPSNVSSF